MLSAVNPWRHLLRSVQSELDRLGQEIEGRAVMPNEVEIVLPGASHERWAPVLSRITAELGGALVAWAERGRRAWYDDRGPFLAVRLEGDSGGPPQITCKFRRG